MDPCQTVQHIANHASPSRSAPTVCDRWQVLTGQRLHLYRVSPAAVSMLSTPNGLQSGTGQQPGRTWSAWHPPPSGTVQQQERGGRRGTIGGSRRISFRAFAR